jgi:hypothetical protein
MTLRRPLQKGEDLGEKFEPVLALLDELDAQYKQGRSLRMGEYLHLFMGAVMHRHTGKKVAQTLIQACLENGIRKGYKTAVTEATGVISQHICRKRVLPRIVRFCTLRASVSFRL